MKFDIGITNGKQFSLEVGNTRLGEYDKLEGIIKLKSKKWTKKEISISIPEGIIAFGVEITLGHNCYLRVEDIQLKIV